MNLSPDGLLLLRRACSLSVTSLVSPLDIARAWVEADGSEDYEEQIGNFDTKARQAIHSATTWALESGRLATSDHIMLAVIKQADLAALSLLRVGNELDMIEDRLRSSALLPPIGQLNLVEADTPGTLDSRPLKQEDLPRELVSILSRRANIVRSRDRGRAWEELWTLERRWFDKAMMGFAVSDAVYYSARRAHFDLCLSLADTTESELRSWQSSGIISTAISSR
jgi:hypothetical protein